MKAIRNYIVRTDAKVAKDKKKPKITTPSSSYWKHVTLSIATRSLETYTTEKKLKVRWRKLQNRKHC